MRRQIANNRGSMLLLVMVIAGFAAVSYLFINYQTQQAKFVAYTDQQTSRADLVQKLTLVLNQGDVCTCHVNPNEVLDSSTKAGLYFPMNNGSIHVPTIRGGCTSLTNPVIASDVSPQSSIGGGLTISSIKVINLQQSGSAWQGTWDIELASVTGGASPKPIQIDQIFSVDSSNASAAFITSCQTTTTSGVVGLVNTCPSGWSMVGQPGLTGTYCISAAPRGPDTYQNANQDCGNYIAGIGVAHICNNNEWYAACKVGGVPALTSIPGNYEWNAEYSQDRSHAVVIGKANCEDSTANRTETSLSKPHGYRCCYP